MIADIKKNWRQYYVSLCLYTGACFWYLASVTFLVVVWFKFWHLIYYLAEWHVE